MDHIDVGLRAAIRALKDVVAPVIAPENAQAREQLGLCIDYLGYMAERLPHLHERDRFELSHQLAMAEAVRGILSDPAAPQPPDPAIDSGRAALQSANASTAEVRQATARVAASVSLAVQGSAQLDPGRRGLLERAVLAASRQMIAFERAWHLPLALDPDPHEVRPLSDFLPVRAEG